MNDQLELEFEEPNWKGHEPSESEHDRGLNVASLMANSQVRITRMDLLVPFSHDPSNKYVGGTATLDNRGWQIEGKRFLGTFNSAEGALNALAEWIEDRRAIMLQQEFKDCGI